MDERLKNGVKWGRELMSNGRIDSRKLQPGDHIFIKRAMSLYSHHGIYIGKGYVIHHTVVEKSCSKLMTACPKCGYNPAKDYGILKTCLDCFIYEDALICTAHSVNLYQYGVTSVEYVIKNAGSCSTQAAKSPEEVVRVAIELYKNGFGKYSLIFNNCEDFATYCKTGVGCSSQVNFAAIKTFAVLAIGAATLTVTAINYIRKKRQKKQVEVLDSSEESS
ncbi:hypothetical protein ACFE04_024351 [Oxalis oulophora]